MKILMKILLFSADHQKDKLPKYSQCQVSQQSFTGHPGVAPVPGPGGDTSPGPHGVHAGRGSSGGVPQHEKH